MADRTLTLPEAIAHVEGFGVSRINRPTRNNNPGDLLYEGWMKPEPYCATLEKVQPGALALFARFPNSQAGWNALKALLLSDAYRKLTIYDAISKFAPPIENDTLAYIDTVCKLVQCGPGDTVEKVMTVSI